MRPRRSLKLLMALAALGLPVAVASGNWVVALVLGPLLGLAWAALSFPTPTVQTAVRTGLASIAWTDDEMSVALVVEAGGGIGMVSVYEALPGDFELISGNTYHVFWVWGHATKTFQYSVACRKRGAFEVQATQWHGWHGLHLRQELKGTADNAQSLVVLPRLTAVPYLRITKGQTQLPPVGTTLTKVGISTTDFRDVRQYAYGDPFKAINWKASARRLSASSNSSLLTNQYESEGRRAAWLLVDASPYMVVGDSLRNPFEVSLHLTMGAAHYFIKRGYRVGLLVYGSGSPPLHPDAGRKQLLRISKLLADCATGRERQDLSGALQQLEVSLLRDSPLCVVFTRLDVADPEPLLAAVKKLSMTGTRSRIKPAPIVVGVNGLLFVQPTNWYERNALGLLRASTRSVVRALHTRGARVWEWRPTGEAVSLISLGPRGVP